MAIQNDQVVSIDYTLKNAGGETLDTTEGGESFAFIQGAGMVIPGMENAVAGKKEGDSFSVEIGPAEGYGEYDPALIVDVTKDRFEGMPSIEEGMQVQAQTEGGVQILTIKKVEGDNVTLDANHPLAGETLFFDIKITAVRDATPEELEHGHVHG